MTVIPAYEQSSQAPGTATPGTTNEGPSTAIPSLPASLANAFLPYTQPASPGVTGPGPTSTRQVGGAPAPDVRRAAGLMSLLDALRSPGPTGHLTPTAGREGPGKGGQPAEPTNAEQSMVDEEINDIAAIAGDPSLAEKFKAGTLSPEERTKLADTTAARIYSHLGLGGKPPPGATSQTIRTEKLPAKLSATLKAQGVDVGPGDTLGTVMDEVARVQPGHDVTTGGGTVTEGPGRPAMASRQSAAQAYGDFVKQYSEKGNTTFQKEWDTILEQTGLLDSSTGAVTPTQVYDAYQKLIEQASGQNQDLQTVVGNLTKANQVPGGAPSSNAASYIQGVAGEYGVQLTPEQITSLADTYGPPTSANEDQIKQAVIGFYEYNPAGPQTGMAADISNSLQNVAGQYFIPLSSQTLGNLVKSAITNASTETPYQTTEQATAGFTEYAKQTAASLYPSLAGAIQRGVTVQDAASPYAEVASNVLGVDPNTIDWSKSQWNSAFNAVDPQTGQATGSMQSLDQWTKTLMSNPVYGYDKTQMAMDNASSLVNALLNTFGKVSDTGFGYSQSTANAQG